MLTRVSPITKILSENSGPALPQVPVTFSVTQCSKKLSPSSPGTCPLLSSLVASSDWTVLTPSVWILCGHTFDLSGSCHSCNKYLEHLSQQKHLRETSHLLQKMLSYLVLTWSSICVCMWWFWQTSEHLHEGRAWKSSAWLPQYLRFHCYFAQTSLGLFPQYFCLFACLLAFPSNRNPTLQSILPSKLTLLQDPVHPGVERLPAIWGQPLGKPFLKSK